MVKGILNKIFIASYMHILSHSFVVYMHKTQMAKDRDDTCEIVASTYIYVYTYSKTIASN